MIRALGFDMKKKELLDLMDQYGIEDSNRITFSDWTTLMKSKMNNRDKGKEIEKAFRLFDLDNKGTLCFNHI